MIEIRTLGRTSVSVDGEPLAGEAAWPKSLALLVYMAREPGPDRRDQILATLWPDREERRARRALNQLLYTLRKASPELDLESIRDAVDFGTDVWLDVEEFESRIEAGDLERAVELYRGPFLVDLAIDIPEFEHWADAQRAEIQRRFQKAVLELARRAKGEGEHERAVGFARRALEADQLDDEAHHLLIECLHASGDRLGALRQFDEYRDLLARELEVEPLEETVELVERIRGEAGGTVAGAEEGDGSGRATARPVARGRALRNAVPPFEPHGLDPEDRGLRTEVAQLLASNLDELEGARSVPHADVMRYWASEDPVRESLYSEQELARAGDALGATALLLGDIYVEGDEVRVLAELVETGGRTIARADARGPREALLTLTDRVASQLRRGIGP